MVETWLIKVMPTSGDRKQTRRERVSPDRERQPSLTRYSASVRREDILAFANRDWDAIAAMKRRSWVEQKARMTPAEAFQVADELRRHVRVLNPAWPTEADRRDDLAVHIRVSESLRRVKPSATR